MYQHLTKLLPAGVVAVALLALGSTSIIAPAWAKPKEEKTTLEDLNCTTGQIAKFDGAAAAWTCQADDDTAPTTGDVEGLGFVTGDHTGAPTTMDVEGLGFFTGDHTVDTDTLGDLTPSCEDGSFTRLDPDGTGVWECLSLSELSSLLNPPLRVFVTSGTSNGDLVAAASALGFAGVDGLLAGDFICNSHADAVGLPGPFVAWLSTQFVNAVDRLNAGSGPWVLPDGTKVADDRAQLTSGNLDVAISRSENNVVQGPPSSVWTGTNSLGLVDIDNGIPQTCLDGFGAWRDTSFKGTIGLLDESDDNWTKVFLVPRRSKWNRRSF